MKLTEMEKTIASPEIAISLNQASVMLIFYCFSFNVFNLDAVDRFVEVYLNP